MSFPIGWTGPLSGLVLGALFGFVLQRGGLGNGCRLTGQLRFKDWTVFNVMFTAILVAAGSSRRMGFDKLAAQLAGKPVLRRSLEALLAARSVRSVVLVCPADRWALLEGMEFKKPVIRVDGGADRHESVAAGLAATAEQAPHQKGLRRMRTTTGRPCVGSSWPPATRRQKRSAIGLRQSPSRAATAQCPASHRRKRRPISLV